MFNRHRIFTSGLRSMLLLAAATGGCAEFDDDELLDEEEQIGQTEQAIQDAMASRGQNGFAPKYLAQDYFCLGGEDCQIGDFNGDGRDDIVTLVPLNGQVWVATSDGRNFVGNRTWKLGFANSQSYYQVGDFNGDGRDDIARINRTSGDVRVTYSDGTRFKYLHRIAAGLCVGDVECRVGNVNGDRYADVVKFSGTADGASRYNDVWVSLGRGWSLSASSKWHDVMCSKPSDCHLADVNGDGMDDLVQVIERWGGGAVSVAKSSGSSFGNSSRLVNAFCGRGETCTLGDVNGSGRADLVTFQRRHYGASFAGPEQADVMTALSRHAANTVRTEFGEPRIRTDRFCVGERVCRLADVNGDGRDDLVSFAQSERGSFGDVYVAMSTFGGLHDWRMDLDSLRAVSVEGDADQPYLVALSFRSTFGQRGSSTVVRNRFRNTSWAHGIRAGELRSIPSWEGEHIFRGVALPTISELLMPSPPPLEIMGTLVIAMEHDWSPWGEVDGMLDRVETELRSVLYRTVERVAPASLVLDRDGFSRRINGAMTGLRTSMEVDLPEFIRLNLVSAFDTDDVIDFHVYIFPALDKEVGTLLPTVTHRHIDLALPGEGFGGYWSTRNDFTDDDGPIKWQVTSQLELVR